MIDVACIDVCAMIEQVSGDLDRAGAVQRGLAIAASCEHQRGIAFDQLAEAIELPEVCCGEDVHDRAARNQGLGLLWCDVPLQQAEGPCPPIALEVQIRAVLDQDVQQRQVLPRGHRRPSAERPSRSIHGGTHFGVILEQRADLFLVARVEPADELLQRCLREGINLSPHRGPALEPIAASDDELGVRERERVAGRRPGVEGANTPQRIRVTRRSGAQQVFRPFPLHFQVGP